ncbi:MAG: hypothetical protein ACP5N2_06220 [Candidatus Nanoarchaeia archaeon]
MFTQLKEGKQYSFLVELSSRDISEQQTEEIITYFDSVLHKQKEVLKNQEKENIDVPLDIFQDGESGLKALTHYLKDKKNLSFSQIGKVLGRDHRTIWASYNQPFQKNKKAKNKKQKDQNLKNKITSKSSTKYKDSNSEKSDNKITTLFINTELFKERKLSILETITVHLLKNYSVKEASVILGKNQMTLWTVKRRAEKKLHRKIQTNNKLKGGQK